MARELFEDTEKMKEFLITLSKMYNTSYSNILLLKSQRKDISQILNKDTIQKYKINVKNNEKPLKIIKRIKLENEVKFKSDEVYDISQTNAVRKENKRYSNECKQYNFEEKQHMEQIANNLTLKEKIIRALVKGKYLRKIPFVNKIINKNIIIAIHIRYI